MALPPAAMAMVLASGAGGGGPAGALKTAAMMQGMGGGGGDKKKKSGGKGGKEHGGGVFGLCGGEPEEDEYRGAVEVVDEEPENAEGQAIKLYLRICVHCAHGLPRGDVYCAVKIGEPPKVTAAKTHTMPDTANPVWEWTKDIQFEVGGAQAPPCMLELYHQGGISDRLVGGSRLLLPTKPTDGPVKKTLRITRHTPEICGPCAGAAGVGSMRAGSLDIVFQVCTAVEAQPDLAKVAEMNEESTEKTSQTISVDILRIKLKRPQARPKKVNLRLELVNLAAEAEYGRGHNAEWNRGSPFVELTPESAEKKGAYNEAIFADEQTPHGWGTAWTVNESRVALMSYALRMELRIGTGPQEHLMGTWQEMIECIADEVQSHNRTLHRWVIMTSAEGGGLAGRVLVEMDVYSSYPHRSMALHRSIEDLPRLRGLLPIEERNRPVTYYGWIFADCLPEFGAACKPFVRLRMGSTRATTQGDVLGDGLNKVYWERPIEVKTTLGERKVDVELWMQNVTGSCGGKVVEKQFGEATFTDIEPDTVEWVHFFGGALDHPQARSDQAFEMAKGAINPPSTYAGSIAVMFTTKPRISEGHWTSLHNCSKKKLLRVRLYRGILLRGYEKRRVQVLVQLPTARLPVDEPKGMCVCPGCGKSTGVTIASKATNRDILCFPGQVDEGGVLRFLQTDSTPSCGSCFGPSPCSTPASRNCAWIERRSPAAYPCELLPQVSHAYVYVQLEGEEADPPKLFGRFRITDASSTASQSGPGTAPGPPAGMLKRSASKVAGNKSMRTLADLDEIMGNGNGANTKDNFTTATGMALKPSWKKLRWDESVCDPLTTGVTKAYYKNALAGFILGWAAVEDAPKTSPALSPVSSQIQPNNDMVQDVSNMQPAISSTAFPAGISPPISYNGAGNSYNHVPFSTLQGAGVLDHSFDQQRQNNQQIRQPLNPAMRPPPSIGDQVYFQPPGRGLPANMEPNSSQLGLQMSDARYGHMGPPPFAFGQYPDDQRMHSTPDRRFAPTGTHAMTPGGLDLSDLPPPRAPTGLQGSFMTRFESPARSNMGSSPQQVNIPPPLESMKPSPARDNMGSMHMRPASAWDMVPAPTRDSREQFVSGADLSPVSSTSMAPGAKTELLSKDLFPNPGGRGCRKFARTASPGDLMRWEEERPEDICTVYCHVDILAARKLPAMDEDGLGDPCFEIRIAGAGVRKEGGVPKSLNPTYMLRTQIPVDVWLPRESRGQASVLGEESQALLPPVAFLALERDVDASGNHFYFDEVATIVIKKPINLDVPKGQGGGINWEPAGEPTPLDVNRVHQAMWHALDGPSSAPFDSTDPGGTPKSLRLRPRVLLAVGYSMQPRPGEPPPVPRQLGDDSCFAPLTTGSSSFYRISLDLLGIRNLNANVTNPELMIMSFWEGNLALDVEDRELPNPNFHAFRPPDDWQEFAATVSNVMRIVPKLDHHVAEGEGEDEGCGERPDDDDDESLATTVGLDEFVGARIKPPLYRAPVIPYLQPQGEQGNSLMSDRSPGKQHAKRFQHRSGQSSVVLLPDVSFVLRNKMGATDYGSLSLTLAPFLDRTGNHMSAMQLASAGFKDLPPLYQKLSPMTHVVTKEEVCSIYIDIFACKTGYLSFNKLVRLGRYLQHMELFSISDRQGTGDAAGEVTHVNFNDNDYVFNNPLYEDYPFVQEMTPVLSVDRQNFDPATPEQLFKPFFSVAHAHRKPPPRRKNKGKGPARGYMKLLDPEDVYECRCRDLQEAARMNGWRSISHEHAPAPIKHTGISSEAKHALKHNQRTWMVPVGHSIRPSKAMRHTRLLAKLRLNTRRPDGTHEPTGSFVIVQFEQAGTVIWVAPTTVSTFEKTGEILFVVRLHDADETCCIIPVPSFDMRYSNETAYYPRKTLTEKWSSLEQRIARRTAELRLEDEMAQATQGKKPLQSPTVPGKAPGSPGSPSVASKELKKADALQAEEEAIADQLNPGRRKMTRGPDGYSLPVPVHENEFVLRLRKKAGGLCFDRVQTDGWYLTVLGDMFPSIRKAVSECENHAEIHEAAKNQYLKEHMNLRTLMTVGEHGESIGMIKGQLHVTEEPSPDPAEIARIEQDCTVMSDIPLETPIEQIWQVDAVTAHLFLLTAYNLQGLPAGRDLRVSVAIVGMPEARCSEVQDLGKNKHGRLHAPDLDIYQHWETTAQLPGQATLRIKIIDRADNATVAEGDIDLEDRWIALTNRNAGCLTDTSFLFSHTCDPGSFTGKVPKKKSPANRIFDDDEEAMDLKAALSPFAPLPIEFKSLSGKDRHTGDEVPMGMLRFWLDLIPAGAPYMGDISPPATFDFEMRISVLSVTDIGIFMDGDHNDLYVKGTLRTKHGRRVTSQIFKTDTHKLAHDTANFNWRWVFPVEAPVDSCSLTMSLHDEDEVELDAPIYTPVTFSLDHIIRLNFQNCRSGKECLGASLEHVIFDSWPGKDEQKGKFAFLKETPTPAVCRIEIKCMTAEAAKAHPVGSGQEGPNALPPPAGRVDMNKPVKYVKALLGPKKQRRAVNLCICCGATAVFVNILVVVYLIVGTGILDR